MGTCFNKSLTKPEASSLAQNKRVPPYLHRALPTPALRRHVGAAQRGTGAVALCTRSCTFHCTFAQHTCRAMRCKQVAASNRQSSRVGLVCALPPQLPAPVSRPASSSAAALLPGFAVSSVHPHHSSTGLSESLSPAPLLPPAAAPGVAAAPAAPAPPAPPACCCCCCCREASKALRLSTLLLVMAPAGTKNGMRMGYPNWGEEGMAAGRTAAEQEKASRAGKPPAVTDQR